MSQENLLFLTIPSPCYLQQSSIYWALPFTCHSDGERDRETSTTGVPSFPCLFSTELFPAFASPAPNLASSFSIRLLPRYCSDTVLAKVPGPLRVVRANARSHHRLTVHGRLRVLHSGYFLRAKWCESLYHHNTSFRKPSVRRALCDRPRGSA